MNRRAFLTTTAAAGALAATGSLLTPRSAMGMEPEGRPNTVRPLPGFAGKRPNIVLINCDDLGYGDLGCYGSRAIKTPHIDALAASGVRFTEFYACDSVCSPSRAGLLTGRYPKRMSLDVPLHPVDNPFLKSIMVRVGYLFGKAGLMDLATAGGAHGISPDEITVAEALKVAQYRTALIGKWHLGDFAGDERYHPMAHGFDEFFGVPHSNDMHPFPLYRGRKVLEEHIEDQSKLTGAYTAEALRIIGESGDAPFFVYLAHTFPHRPLFASEDFSGKSDAGLFGDAVEEIDWSVGEIVKALQAKGRYDDTVIFFTSDNGPWYQGSPGVLRGRKGQSFEGGNRVPMIIRWPGGEGQGTSCHGMASNLDIFPTLLAAAGLALPTDRIVDGKDIGTLIRQPAGETPHDALFYYHHGELEGVRVGQWKYFRAINHYVWPLPVNKKLGTFSEHTTGPQPLLFNLALDPGEAYNVATKYPKLAEDMEALIKRWETEMAKNPKGF